MKPIDEIKKALRICKKGSDPCWVWNCKDCPYQYVDNCHRHIADDALELIENLEERIAIMEEGLMK